MRPVFILIIVPASSEAVWRAITDVDAFPSWRRDVKSVTRLPDRDARQTWVEEGSSGRLTLAVEGADPPRVLVVSDGHTRGGSIGQVRGQTVELAFRMRTPGGMKANASFQNSGDAEPVSIRHGPCEDRRI